MCVYVCVCVCVCVRARARVCVYILVFSGDVLSRLGHPKHALHVFPTSSLVDPEKEGLPQVPRSRRYPPPVPHSPALFCSPVGPTARGAFLGIPPEIPSAHVCGGAWTNTQAFTHARARIHTHEQGFWGWEHGETVRCGESRDETTRVLVHQCSLQLVICPFTVLRVFLERARARASARVYVHARTCACAG